MKAQTHLSNTIDAVSFDKMIYDKNVKEFLSDIQVLARITKYIVSEVEDLSIDQIMECIDSKSIEVGSVSVIPGLTNLGKIENLQTEDAVTNEGYINFDIRFSLLYKEKAIKIIINIETQKSTDSTKLGYHLENRIVYYLARLISSQKEKEFCHSEYDNIKKVYSIWICMDTEENQDSVTKIALKAESLFGPSYELAELDKMCRMIVRIREKTDVKESKNALVAMLEDMLKSEEKGKKKRKLEQKYDMKMTVELEGRVDKMCNLSEAIEARGIEQGIEQGLVQGIIKTCQALKASKEVAAERLKAEFSMPDEKIEEIIEKYWEK